jgi:hypothetical protein
MGCVGLPYNNMWHAAAIPVVKEVFGTGRDPRWRALSREGPTESTPSVLAHVVLMQPATAEPAQLRTAVCHAAVGIHGV